MVMKHTICGLLTWVVSAGAYATPLVTDAQIKTQKDLTKVEKLTNGIPVIFRSEPSSDILQVVVSFRGGIRNLPAGSKSLSQLLFAVMPDASKSFSKEKVFAATEKYALQLGCAGGIEAANCEIGTLSEHWPEVLPMFKDLILNPALNAADVKLDANRAIADLQSNMEDPGRYSNEVVNRVFYPTGHPYRQMTDDAMKELSSITPDQLRKYHESILNASSMHITVVGSYPQDKMLKELNEAFGSISSRSWTPTPVPAPPFDPKQTLAFEHREIPTAYIKIKFNALPANDPDEIEGNLMIKIFDEELSEEIRTRRSLSYAVYSFMIQYTEGIGVISASTSKPMETLAAIGEVIEKMKKQKMDNKTLEEHKTVYATNYYLTQETHSALASALAGIYLLKGDINPLYDMPRRLEKITAADVQRLAQRMLTNLRVGVVFNQNKFENAWAEALVNKTKS
jgi:predicted Zn-dependent peptidase